LSKGLRLQVIMTIKGKVQAEAKPSGPWKLGQRLEERQARLGVSSQCRNVLSVRVIPAGARPGASDKEGASGYFGRIEHATAGRQLYLPPTRSSMSWKASRSIWGNIWHWNLPSGSELNSAQLSRNLFNSWTMTPRQASSIARLRLQLETMT
jgi:hypothetical protein